MREYRYSIPGWIFSFVILLNLMSSNYFQRLFFEQFVENQNIGLSVIIAIFAIIATPATGYIISSIPFALFHFRGGYSGLWERHLKYSLKEKIGEKLLSGKSQVSSEILNAPHDSFLSFYWQGGYIDQKLVDWVSRRISVHFINRSVTFAIVIGNLLSLWMVSKVSELTPIHYLILFGSAIIIAILEINSYYARKEALGTLNFWLERTFNKDFKEACCVFEEQLKIT